MTQKATAVLLVLALSLPMMQKAYHAFTDHRRVDCQSDLPSHYHGREYHCSFDQFLLLPFDFQAPQGLSEPVMAFFPRKHTFKEQVFISNRTLYIHLRAPPGWPSPVL